MIDCKFQSFYIMNVRDRIGLNNKFYSVKFFENKLAFITVSHNEFVG